MFDWLEIAAVLSAIIWRLWTPHHNHIVFGCIFFIYLFLTWTMRGVGEDRSSHESCSQKLKFLGFSPTQWWSRLIQIALMGLVFSLGFLFLLGHTVGEYGKKVNICVNPFYMFRGR